MSKPVVCLRCGEEWPRDPALEVTCPDCHAEPGHTCVRPSGHSGPFVNLHYARKQAAFDQGFENVCSKAQAVEVVGGYQLELEM